MSVGFALLLVSIPILVIGCFVLRKEKFLYTDEFKVYKDFSIFSPIVTFWLWKLLLLTLGIGLTLLGILAFFQ
ncbi:hypothetical protein [Planococcus salinarum]|uniref:hypothetical protein n=1 Tax=Planococcus salinarum TaxID=622695 RepID=UPI000E3D3132|nr:hypothetical protein [Planococcus salinarum]TAA72353.1 hypothetical protein D2909_07215 [Planococcus salinarum]